MLLDGQKSFVCIKDDEVCNYFLRCYNVATFTTYIRYICCNYNTLHDIIQISKKENFVFRKIGKMEFWIV